MSEDKIVRNPYKSQAINAELAKLRDRNHEFNLLLGSRLWKIIMPLRELIAWIKGPKKQLRRYASASIRLLKIIYKGLGFSISSSEHHKAWIDKIAPLILKNCDISLALNFSTITSKNPVVSVVIPVFGNIAFTLNCLRSIFKYSPEVDFEIIVVDDCSLDESVSILSQIKGIYIHKNTINQGFIKSCNTGASIARGEYICFLNNDTMVTEGWLDYLYKTFKDLPGTGFVGSKLIYPNGTLQEAGGIIWRDGSAWNFGRNQDPDLPIFNYAREVDYCSGASIMVPRKIFNDIRGFDELYTPAYCEDSDLALKIRSSGLRVIYQPASVVIHFEGVSSGIDINQGVKAYQVENTKKLYQRWEQHLFGHHPSGVNVDDAKDRVFTSRVLVVDHCTPTPNQDAGSVTTFNTLILLRELGFQVTFVAEDNYFRHTPFTEDLQRIGIEVLYAPYVNSLLEHIEEFGSRYDLVFLFRPMVVQNYIKAIRTYCKNAKVLYHTIDLHFLRMSRGALLNEKLEEKIASEKMKSIELKAIQDVDAAIVHSTVELEILKPLLPNASIYVFPLILKVRGAKNNFKSRKDILFVGGFNHVPNIDAISFFVREIFHLIQKRIPNIRLFIVGSNPTLEVLDLATDQVKVLGFVDDLNSLFESVRLSVAPIRYGAGIKGKIGTSMASGLPVVATSIAAEGMSLSNGDNIILADNPLDFANQVIKVYSEELLWSHLSFNASEFSESAWGKDAALSRLSNVLGDLGLNFKCRGYPFDLYE